MYFDIIIDIKISAVRAQRRAQASLIVVLV
jgi:hypothetical protein